MKNKFLALATVILCSIGCQKNCQSEKAEQENAEVSKELAASVGKVGVPLARLAKEQDRVINNFKRANRPVSPPMVISLRGEILKKLIDNELIKKYAEEQNISLDRIERVEALDQFKERIGGAQNYKAYLDSQDISEEEMMGNLVTEKLKEKIIAKEKPQKEPSDDEITKFYNDNPNMFGRPEMVKAKHVLLKISAEDSPEQQKLIHEKAQKIYAEGKAGKPFATLVATYSESPSKDQGGDLGYLSRGRMVKAFEDPVFSANVGDIVGPLRTEFGEHIVLIEEKTPAQLVPFPEARSRIVDALRMQANSKVSEEVLKTLRQKADVEIFDSSLSLESYRGPSKEAMKN